MFRYLLLGIFIGFCLLANISSSLAMGLDAMYGSGGVVDFSSIERPSVALFNHYGADAKDICWTITNTGDQTISLFFSGYTDDGKAYTAKTVGLKESGHEVPKHAAVLLCFNRIRSLEVSCPISEADDLEKSSCGLTWEVTHMWNEMDDRVQALG